MSRASRAVPSVTPECRTCRTRVHAFESRVTNLSAWQADKIRKSKINKENQYPLVRSRGEQLQGKNWRSSRSSLHTQRETDRQTDIYRETQKEREREAHSTARNFRVVNSIVSYVCARARAGARNESLARATAPFYEASYGVLFTGNTNLQAKMHRISSRVAENDTTAR